jgi:tetratricopeptide (TPR) repeat protein
MADSASQPASARSRVRAWQVAFVVFLAAPLFYLLVARTNRPKVPSPSPPPPLVAPEASSLDRARALALSHPGYDAFLELGLRLYRDRQFGESIVATERALSFDPKGAAAYNNLGSAFAELGMWDEAIEACQKALSLEPGFELARNNLAWALREKATASPVRTPGTR